MDPNVAPITEPQGQAPVDPQVQPPVAPAAAEPVAPTGTAEAPFIVPAGTQAKFEELKAGGWKDEEVEAYLATIEDEDLRAKIKDGIDGKAHLSEEDPAPVQNDEPFTAEELAQLDPSLAARISFFQDQLLEQMDAVEQAKGELPPQMQRLLQDPVVRARLDSVSKGEEFVPSELNADYIKSLAAPLVEAGNAKELAALLEDVIAAVPEVILQQKASILEEQKRTIEAQAREHEINAYMASGFSKIDQLPEFKSNKPVFVETAQGRIPNAEHPGMAFAMWIQDSMEKNGLTLPLIEEMGGLEQLAYTWLAKQKGGFGQIVKGAVDKSSETLRDKLLRTRNSALAKSAARTLSTASPGTARSLMHGVDVDLALRDHSYAASATKGLSAIQQSEVAKEMRKRAGIA